LNIVAKSDKWPDVLIRALRGDAKGMTPSGKTVDAALAQLRQALSTLESAVDGRFERERAQSDIEGEVRRVHADRSRLAQELDQAEFRANRLEEVNREVSRRLVTAMETIRAVLDR
jgi:chromosome segregation ATPase